MAQTWTHFEMTRPQLKEQGESKGGANVDPLYKECAEWNSHVANRVTRVGTGVGTGVGQRRRARASAMLACPGGVVCQIVLPGSTKMEPACGQPDLGRGAVDQLDVAALRFHFWLVSQSVNPKTVV